MSRFRLAAIAAVLAALLAALGGWQEAPLTYMGRVVDVANAPVAGASVVLLSGGQSAASVVTRPDGSYRLTGGDRLDPAELVVSAEGYLTARLRPSGPGRVRTQVLDRLALLSGTVSDDAGLPVPDADVLVEVPASGEAWDVAADDQGRFTLADGLAPGVYAVDVSAPMHDAFSALLRLSANDAARLWAFLPRQMGSLSITSDPSGQQVILDGTPLRGCVTPCTTSLVIGSHKVGIDADLYVPWQQAIDVTEHQTLQIGASLERKKGTLILAGPGGDLMLGDQDLGTGSWSGLVPTGTYQVSYRTQGYWPALAMATVDWNGTSHVTFASGDLTAIKPGDSASFLAGLKGYLDAAGGQYAVYFQDLGSNQQFGKDQDSLLEAASDIKLPLALYLLHESESGGVNLDDKVTLEQSDWMGGTGTLQGNANPGDQYSYRDLLTLMIQQSDNIAWQALQRVLGADKIDAYAASLGAPDCHQIDDNCTPHELGLLLAGLYHGTTLNSSDTSQLLGLMEHTAFDDRIGYYLGGATVAHKTGADGCIENDAGIVYAPHPFVMAMFTCTDSGTLQPLRDVGAAAFYYFSK